MEAQFITDFDGNRISVVLPIDKYNKMLEELDELNDIRLYDQAKTRKGDFLPADKAFEMIESDRKK